MSAGFWKPTVRLRARAAPSAVRTDCWRPNCTNAACRSEAVENALTLAAARRLARPADAPPLGIIRSLAYFSPVIEEVLRLRRGMMTSAPALLNPVLNEGQL